MLRHLISRLSVGLLLGPLAVGSLLPGKRAIASDGSADAAAKMEHRSLAEDTPALQEPHRRGRNMLKDICRVRGEGENIFTKDGKITLGLDKDHADYRLAQEAAEMINSQLSFQSSGRTLAKALDRANIEVTVPTPYRDDPVAFISQVLSLPMPVPELDEPVAIDERTGSIAVRRGRKPEPVADKSLYTVVYNVADLVMPRPNAVSVFGIERVRGKPQLATANFKPIVELITQKVEPRTWNSMGGPGSIAPLETNLRLVINQAQSVHEKIVDLLEQARRLRDLQVAIKMTFLTVETGAVLPFLDVEGSQHASLLDCQQAKRLLQAAHEHRQVNVLTAPVLTVMSGKTAWGSRAAVGDKRPGRRCLLAHAVVPHDRRKVQLKLATGGPDPNDMLASALLQVVPDGATFLVDLTSWLASLEEFYGAVGDAGPKSSGPREYLLVTPRIIVEEEEEERLARHR